MATELLLAAGTKSWGDIASVLTESISELLEGEASVVTASMPNSGQRVDARRLDNGQLRLSAAGNDSLVGGDRLTVRDERAVIAVGFSVGSASWGNFYWDWSVPVTAEHVASGIVRTMRDIYKGESTDIEVSTVL